MALGKATAVVIGSFPLGESDRVVTFFSRERGKIRGVA
ncbi:MAG: DNA repair protein RecO, partial [Candidatus Rokuibacteriota bacterium]